MKAFCETWFCCSAVTEIYIDPANNEEDDQVSIHSVEDHVSFTTGSITLLIQSVVAGIAMVVGFMIISVRKFSKTLEVEISGVEPSSDAI